MKLWLFPGVALAVLAMLAFNGWLFMLCMGAAHSIWHQVPAFGYWTSVAVLALVGLVARLLGLGR